VRFIQSICLALLALGLVATDANAHGGSFRGPPGGVPPGLRPPSDPEPPPPPPSDPSPPGGPTTGGDDPTGPITPEGLGGPSSGGDGPPQLPTSGPTGAGNRPKTGRSLTFESWRYWWGYNKERILNLRKNLAKNSVSSGSALAFGDTDAPVSAARRITRIDTDRIVEALRASLNRADDHEDIHGGALVALGKVGSAEFIPAFQAAMHNRYKTDSGKRIDFGYQATESAVLALGLLRDLDETQKTAVREICLRAIEDDKLRTRERTWAAVVLGLQRDKKAIGPLFDLLDRKYSDDNIPAGILAGIGLIGDESIAPELADALYTGRLRGKRLSPRVHSFVGYALLKIGHADEETMAKVRKALTRRSLGTIVKRTVAIAAGVLGSHGTDKEKARTVEALLKFIRKSPDPSSQNFAMIALSQIGTPKAIKALKGFAEDGRYGQRPFAALGLATMVFYRDEAAANGAEGLDPKVRRDIVNHLRKLSERSKAKDQKAAFYLARGIIKDKTAIEDLNAFASKRSEDPILRGYACLALGLIGTSSTESRDAIKTALRTRKSAELRMNAAVGLGLLHDPEVIPYLLQELEEAKSFAVHGQLVQAIGLIGDRAAIAPLTRILEDSRRPAQLRAMAVVGLGMIGDREQVPTLSRLASNYNYRATVPDLDELLFIL